MPGLGKKRAPEGRLDRVKPKKGAVPPSTADEGSNTASSSAPTVTLAKAGPRPKNAPSNNPFKGLATSSAGAAPSVGLGAFDIGANSAAAAPAAPAAAAPSSSSSPTGAFNFASEFVDFNAGVKAFAAAHATEKKPEPEGEVDDEAGDPATIAAITTHSPRATPTEAIDKNAAEFDLFDLNAYPSYTKDLAASVQEKLRSLCPVWSEEAQIDFQVFASTWQTDTNMAAKKNQDWSTCAKKYMMGSFKHLLSLRPASIEQQAEDFLKKMLNSNKYPPGMELMGRVKAMSDLASFCVSHLGTGSEKKVPCSSITYAPSTPDKPGLLTLFSTRGSGKTQLLKYVLFDVAKEQLAGGYVLICECSRSRSNLPFGDELAELNRSELRAMDIERFLMSIIARHVRERGFVFSSDGVLSVRDAYCVWQKACGEKYRPLIVFDTTEDLPQMTRVERTDRVMYRTILEAFAAHLPFIHGMVACGSLRIDTSYVNDVTNCTVTSLPPLNTLSTEEYRDAVAIWSDKKYKEVSCTMRILHQLCGGVPRLLTFSAESIGVQYVNYLESWGAVISRCIDECYKYVSLAGFEEETCETNNMYALAALASGTRTYVKPDKPVPFTSVTWSVPQQGILYSDSTGRATMPPALFLEGNAHAISEDLATATNPSRYSDVLVRSWPKGLSLSTMHCPIPLAEIESLTVDRLKATSRGKPWEHQLAHCIVGRWYYLFLVEWQLQRIASRTESPAADAPALAPSSGGKAKLSVQEEVKMQKRTFTLYEVMYGGGVSGKVASSEEAKPATCSKKVKSTLKRITVDFSGGVSEMDCKEDPTEGSKCFYLNTDASGHHDAKFRATREGKSIIVCVQLRHGHSKTKAEIKRQIFKKPPTSKMLQQESEATEADLVDLLLVIESGPPDKEMVAFGHESKFNNRAIRIDGSYFASASVLSILDPAYALRNEDPSPQATVPPAST